MSAGQFLRGSPGYELKAVPAYRLRGRGDEQDVITESLVQHQEAELVAEAVKNFEQGSEDWIAGERIDVVLRAGTEVLNVEEQVP
jgi:hypothetical protein